MNEKELKGFIDSVEKRLTKQIDNVDICVKELKKAVIQVKELQLTCEGHKKIEGLDNRLTNHMKDHELVKSIRKTGFTKLQFYVFVVFAFIAAVVSITTLILHMTKGITK